MSSGNLSPSEVKSIENELECSPSQHQPTSPLYHGSEDNPQAKAKTAGKASAAKSAEKTFGEARTPAVSKGNAKNKSIAKAT